jgi:hypothetical protein
MEGNVAQMRAKRKAYRLLVGKPEGRRQLRRVRRGRVDKSWKDRMGWCGLDWSGYG